MRKISLDEIAAATKIGTRSLKALEDEQFGKLPGGIFNKGFVRSYARFLGINEEQAVSDYLAAAGEPENKPPEIDLSQLIAQQEAEKKSAKPRSRALDSINADASGFPWMAILALILIVVAASGGWKLYLRHREQAEAKVREAATQSMQATQSLPAQTPSEQPPATTDVVPPTQTTAPPSQTPVPSTQLPSASPSAQDSAVPVSTTPAETATPEIGSTEGGFVLSVRAKSEAWVSITADGNTVMSGIMHASNQKSVHARDRIVFKTGNAGGVEIAFNGKVLDPIGRDNEVRKVVISSNGTVQ